MIRDSERLDFSEVGYLNRRCGFDMRHTVKKIFKDAIAVLNLAKL